MTTDNLPVLAILGGTGDLGTGLARRWAQAGYRVIIGSRTQEKAEAAVADLRAEVERLTKLEDGNMKEDLKVWIKKRKKILSALLADHEGAKSEL